MDSVYGVRLYLLNNEEIEIHKLAENLQFIYHVSRNNTEMLIDATFGDPLEKLCGSEMLVLEVCVRIAGKIMLCGKTFNQSA